MCIKGDGDGSSAVGDYVAQLRTEFRQQPAHERRRWLFFELKKLVLKNSNSWKPWLVDIARWLKRDEIMPVIMDAFMGELVDSSAAAPGPAMGFIVAPYCFVFLLFACPVDVNAGFGSLGG